MRKKKHQEYIDTEALESGYFDMGSAKESRKEQIYEFFVQNGLALLPKKINYDDIDKRLKNKITSDILTFVLATFSFIGLAFILQNITYIVLAMLSILLGAFFVYKTYYLITRELTQNINGIIIAIDKKSLQNRSFILHIQDTNENVYAVNVIEYASKYKIANEVSFIINKKQLTEEHFIDGEYRVGSPILIQITNAKIA